MQREPSVDIAIEGMREEDLDEILEIEKKCFVAPWSRDLFREALSFPLSFNFVARKRVDNRVVGYANFYLIKDEVQVLNIAVAPEVRKKGYATTLLDHAIAILVSRGGEDFFLEVREGNGEAIRLYDELGFRRIGRRKRYYPETNEDAIVMRLKVHRGTDQ
jgi:[ribosomal protein S18]-alanine N-acetyltransferase